MTKINQQERVDAGANFYKCDFQVHTPRDISWGGEFKGATATREREAFASALIRDCIKKGIDAIAITDHHDLCLFPYVRTAASLSKSNNSDEKMVVVFPGIELTLSTPPCQALLLFNPATPDEALKNVFAALGLTPNPDSHTTTMAIEGLDSSKDLHSIHRSLDPLIFNPDEPDAKRRVKLAGKYILLPHVRPSGHKTLLRPGMHKQYAEMPCVGGYIEGHFYENLGLGDRKILEGKDKNWGAKAIGVFQTSDNRECQSIETDSGKVYDFTGLGKWPTWLKWTEPTVEAIRQACLAKESRISHRQPELPNRYISAVTISGSVFLGKEHLGINPQFTAFIGGRGTGKSTMMEYLRWALCDDPSAFAASSDRVDELPDFEKRRNSLINKTLKPKDGIVSVTYIKNGTPYVISRSSNDTSEKATVTSPDGTNQELNGKQIRLEFPLISYAQKQLSCVGTLPEEVHRLIREPIEDKVTHLNDELREIILPKLQERRLNEIRLADYLEKEKNTSNRIKFHQEQIKTLQEQLLTKDSKDSLTINSHAQIIREKQWLDSVKSHVSQLRDVLLESRASLDGFPDLKVPSGLPSEQKLSFIASDINETRQVVISALDTIINGQLARTTTDENATKAMNSVDAIHEQHEKDYELALSRHQEQESVVERIESLNEQLEVMANDLIPIASEVQRLSAWLQQPGENWWNVWLKKHTERANVLKQQCIITSQRADNAFRATVRSCGNRTQVTQALTTFLLLGRSIHSRDEKVLTLEQSIHNAENALVAWSELIDELTELINVKGGASLPDCPKLKAAGLTDTNIGALQNGLSKEIIEANRFPLFDDEIVFEFAFGKDNTGSDAFIPFEDASPGQQATALLKTLLAEAGPPLLIDQPEEDLDNEQMCDIAERIIQTKSNRQLLFVSHNANIVVNGDAELVVCFAYQDPNNRTKGKIEKTGSIDYEPIRQSIASVMEGGRDAFHLRYQKYGY